MYEGGGGYPLLKKNYDPPSLQNHPTPSEMAFDPLPQILSFFNFFF